MNEEGVTICIAPNCEREIALNSPLCSIHKEQLQKTEEAILKDAGATIRRDMRQFERLIYHEDDVTLEGVLDHPRLLTAADIANRMVWPVKKVRQMLKKFREDEYRG